ncbi:MAG: arginine repressor [Bacillota bacterium]|nr:arginine repressor [Bacillota bacterium]
MKYGRHAKILEIIKENIIETQEDLVAALKNAGYEATQATVSRDIRELRLIKVSAAGGKYRYATASADTGSGDIESRLNVILGEAMVSVDYAMNQIVIKTLPGMANAAASAVDNCIANNSIVGTIAGDDTLLLIMRDEKEAVKLVSYLNRILK